MNVFLMNLFFFMLEFLNAVAAFIENFVSSKGLESNIPEDLKAFAARANYDDDCVPDEQQNTTDGGKLNKHHMICITLL